jgi:hypothetical protein
MMPHHTSGFRDADDEVEAGQPAGSHLVKYRTVQQTPLGEWPLVAA